MRVINATRNRVMGECVREAATVVSRMIGLLGRRSLAAGEGLWIRPCNAIHSVGMRFEFDAVFLDRNMRVVHLVRKFGRNRISRIVRLARGVLELPPGTIEETGTEVGDEVAFRT